MKKLVFILFTIILLISTCIIFLLFYKTNTNTLTVNIDGKTYKNTTESIDTLITKTIKQDELNTNINFLAKSNLIECIRINKHNFYVILKTTDNVYMVLLYDISKPKFPKDKWILGNISSTSFKEISIGKPTLKEVMKLDPNGNYNSVLYASSLPSLSIHHTIDGYFITIEYSFSRSEILVKSIEILPPDRNIIYMALTENDRRDLTQKANK